MTMIKLLLVDDDAFLRDMYAIKFREQDYDISAADSAHQALTLIRQTPDFQVILLDMIMPGMTGIELMVEIKHLFPEMNPCFVVLSNQGQDADVAAAKEAGAAGYIIKAETIPSEVVTQVAKLITQSKN